jgi:hypothetical protein
MQFCALPRLKGRVKVVLGGTLMKIKELIYGNLPMAGIFPYEGIYHPARPMCSKRIKRLILDRILPLIDIPKSLSRGSIMENGQGKHFKSMIIWSLLRNLLAIQSCDAWHWPCIYFISFFFKEALW